jgi:diguanylate cyclase (GGDEF)-like protein
MTTSYPEVSDAELRAQYQKPDQAQAQKILRFILYVSPVLLYVDLVVLGVGTPFLLLLALRLGAMGYTWWILRKASHAAPFSPLEQHLFYWAALILISQLLSDFLSPATYLGHFYVDAWICMVSAIVLPIRAAYVKRLILPYLLAVVLLSLRKIFPNVAHQVIVLSVLLLSAYTGKAVAATMYKFRLKLLSAEFELQRKEITDPLTGVLNRREFLRVAEAELLRHSRLAKPLSLLIFDVDGLKQINAQFGAGSADMVLVEISKRMQRATRNYDCLARYGTEEFIVLLPEAEAAIASKVAQRAVHTIAAIPIPVSGKEVRVSANVGIASLLEDDTLTAMLLRAEDDLRRVRSATPILSEVSHDMVFA